MDAAGDGAGPPEAALTGICGVVGAGPDALRAAAAPFAWRGPLDVWTDGRAALAAYGGRAVPVPGGALVADAPLGRPDLDRLLRGTIDAPSDFALARWDGERLLLARDAWGQRPLFWAAGGGVFAFASDVEVLVALGAATGALDRETVTTFLAMLPPVPDRTPFEGVRRLVGGRWLEWTRHGLSYGRWFRPEDVAEQPWTELAAAERLADLLTDAVAEQAAGRRVALLLSGGRDSGAVAAALARAGVVADCLTHVSDVPGATSEAAPAKALADALGHRWHPVEVPTAISAADLRGAVRAAGTPFGPAGAQYALATRRALDGLGCDVLFDGDGGDLLFSTSPVVAADLLRAGRVLEAVRTAWRGHRTWVHPLVVQARATVRAWAPTALVEWREARRPVPPWVRDVDRRAVTRRAPYLHRRWLVAPRTERDDLVEGLLTWGGGGKGEVTDRLYGPVGVTALSPLLHPAVVRLALELPVPLRTPFRDPKPVLTGVLLRGLPPRVKASHRTAWDSWIPAQAAALPDLGTARSALVKHGYVRTDEFVTARQLRWVDALRGAADVEAWLSEEPKEA